MMYDNHAHYSEGIEQSGDIVAMHQDEYCALCNTDLGGGECPRCRATVRGYSICGYCGIVMRKHDYQTVCPETIVKR